MPMSIKSDRDGFDLPEDPVEREKAAKTCFVCGKPCKSVKGMKLHMRGKHPEHIIRDAVESDPLPKLLESLPGESSKEVRYDRFTGDALKPDTGFIARQIFRELTDQSLMVDMDHVDAIDAFIDIKTILDSNLK